MLKKTCSVYAIAQKLRGYECNLLIILLLYSITDANDQLQVKEGSFFDSILRIVVVIDEGFSNIPTLYPAYTLSRVLRNTSTLVTVVFLVSLNPTRSTVSPTLIMSRSTHLVTTIPCPVMEKTYSTVRWWEPENF